MSYRFLIAVVVLTVCASTHGDEPPGIRWDGAGWDRYRNDSWIWQPDLVFADSPVMARVVRLPVSLPTDVCENSSFVRITHNSVRAPRWPLAHALSYTHDISRTRVLAPPELAGAVFDVSVTWASGNKRRGKHKLGRALAAAGGFSAHMERREMDVHVLTVGNEDSTTLQPTGSHLEGTLDARAGHVSAKNHNMGALCAALEELLRRPVLDKTGLAGAFDWTLTWEPDDLDSLVVALRRDLGLKLDRDTRPIEVLVVAPDSTSPDASHAQEAPPQVDR